MIFPTIEFAVFFLLIYLIHWATYRYATPWKWFLLAGSYFFYGYWDWRFLGLLAASSIVNHVSARGIRRFNRPWARRGLLTAAVTFNLGTIAFFKYYGFFVEQAYVIAYRLGIPCSLPLLDIILPVGISFFTFQALSYVIDVYRGQMEPGARLLDFALYLSFFPQLVAGPIVRARDLVPQLAAYRPPLRIDTGRAALLILGGLFKKTVIANYLAEAVVDPVFGYPAAYGTWDTVLAVSGYAVQIYCDFSAYSDMAIGFCLLLGIHIPINFDAPYTSTSLQEFWRRWHISLSTFLRDYLYIPLGGSRAGNLGVYRNLMITFLLGGLWHGAGWNFIIWGGLHGLYLSVERRLADRRRAQPAGIESRWQRSARQVMVFFLVGIAWIFFRAQTFADAGAIFSGLTRWRSAPQIFNWLPTVAIVAGLASQMLDNRRRERWWDALNRLPAIGQGLLAALILVVILALGPQGVAPFIYFQF